MKGDRGMVTAGGWKTNSMRSFIEIERLRDV